MQRNSEKSTPDYLVFLIGFADKSRIRNTKNELRKEGISKGVRVVLWQPETMKFPKAKPNLYTTFRLLRSTAKRKFGILRASRLVVRILLQAFTSDKTNSRGSKRLAELAVTEKHTRSLANFLESNKKLVLVFEDDVICLDGKNSHTLEALSILQSIDEPWFLSLTHAYSMQELGVSATSYQGSSLLSEISPPSTNTCAAYAMNRKGAERVLEAILLEPRLRELPADWMLNAVIRDMKIRCLYLNQPAFLNGSLHGVTQSTIQF